MNQRLSRFSSVRVLLLGGVALVATSQVGAVAPTFTVDEESPIALDSFVYTGAPGIKVTAGTGYVLCANTPWQGGSPNASALRLIPTNPDGFTFGAQNVTGGAIVLNDVRSFKYRVSTTAMVDVNTAGGQSTLGCYVTDATGTRTKWYNGLFDENFDFDQSGPAPSGPCSPQRVDSCVGISVDSLVDSGQGIVYTYYINYHLPGGIYNYVLRDGYNGLFSSTNVWCITAGIAATDCIPGTSHSTSTVDYFVTGSVSSAIDGRLKVVRTTSARTTIADLQAANSPLVLAALFPEASPNANERAAEFFLNDNVAKGTATVSGTAASQVAGL